MADKPDSYYLELAEKWMLGTITVAEKQEYARWYNDIAPGATLEVGEQAEAYKRRIWAKIAARKGDRRRIRRLGWVAAASVLVLGTGAYLLLGPKHRSQAPVAQAGPRVQDLAPGGDRATLTLAGGQTISLDSSTNGVLAQQGNSQVRKVAGGQLAYVPVGSAAPAVAAYNTLSTPRGGQYRLVLPDGTAIWLNAESSVTYPTTFSGAGRSVVITGEAYFEVHQEKDRPFKVFIGSPQGMEVDVLGTHFNVNAYADEGAVRTTLLEGSIKVRGKVLLPGEQAQAAPDGSLKVVSQVDTEKITAWKRGVFQFDNDDIRAVMRQLARWYDVEVVYQGPVTEDFFSGKLPRDASAQANLHILEENQVHFRIEGRKILVLP